MVSEVASTAAQLQRLHAPESACLSSTTFLSRSCRPAAEAQRYALPGFLFMKLLSLIAICSVVLAVTCERATKVRLVGGNPPIFILSGSGSLSTLVIHGPKQRDIVGDRAYAVWEIVPTNGDANAKSIESLGQITYGVAPEGYKQEYPEQGTPPALVENQRYGYWFQTINAPHARGYFEIRNGKAVPTGSIAASSHNKALQLSARIVCFSSNLFRSA